MKMLIVGGTFDEKGGKASYIVYQMSSQLRCETINGGTLEDIYSFRPHDVNILIWMPLIDNAEDKILPRLKVMNPKMLLVSSKRNIADNALSSDNNALSSKTPYSMFELVTRAINAKANLSIIISKHSIPAIHNVAQFEFSLIDPLGNIFCDKQPLTSMLFTLQARLLQLSNSKRIPSIQLNDSNSPYTENNAPVSDDFLNLVKHYGKRFDVYIQGNNPDRFLGNASTRCQWGFPSTRINNYTIMVSKRNVNKNNISAEDFVEVSLHGQSQVLYKGKNKPSVDTPIQIALYNHFPRINYIIHGHCYIKGAPFTKTKLPCGDLNEVKEILKIANCKETRFEIINLIGHGCLIMSDSMIRMLPIELESRPLPEE